MSTKAKKSSKVKYILIALGGIAIGLVIGYKLGVREQDSEFYEVSFEDI